MARKDQDTLPLIMSFQLTLAQQNQYVVKKPRYGSYETNIIMKHVKTLLGNDRIERCEGPWGVSIVLGTKPHQDHVKDIDNFVWRMCISYSKLNAITKPFEFPILRCNDAITIINIGS